MLVMDNLGSHKGRAVRHAIHTAGAKLFLLSTYSPDLNRIEQVFAKLKHLLRNAAAQSFDALTAAVGQLLSATLRLRNASTTSTPQDMDEPKAIPFYGRRHE
jgi:putative transposase